MATITTTTTTTKPPKPTTAGTKLVCFSFAAYAKTLIDHLKSLNIPIHHGLTDLEFTSIESSLHFTFPPDLRAILQEGLPIGPHFPNWRSSSLQQLQILLNLPFLNLSKNLAQNNFWVDSWGDKPEDINMAIDKAKGFWQKAPVLVPIYRNCYIPSSPSVIGNPVFYVDDCHVRILNLDVAEFFQEMQMEWFSGKRPADIAVMNWWRREKVSTNVPAWAPTDANRIDFWSEVAEKGRRVLTRVPTSGWWSGGDLYYKEMRECLEEVFWRLRDGGWREEEVKEMMMMDGCDQEMENDTCGSQSDEEDDVTWQLRVLSLALLRAGWSREDVVYSLDLEDQDDDNSTISINLGKSVSLDFQVPSGCSREDVDHDHRKSSMLQLMNLQSLKV